MSRMPNMRGLSGDKGLDVWTATFECGPNSGMDRAGESATAAPRADNLGALNKALGYVRHHLARGTPPRARHLLEVRC